MADRVEVGDIIRMKKPHPCGSQEGEGLGVGGDFRLKCMGWGHQIRVPGKLVEKKKGKVWGGKGGGVFFVLLSWRGGIFKRGV